MELGLPGNLTVFRAVRWWPKGEAWIRKRMDWIVLVKVQVPVASSEEEPNALVYNEDRSLYGFAPIEEPLRKAMGERTKGYFFAQSKGKTLRLYGRAANQDW